MMALFLGHIYLGSIGMRGAYQAMKTRPCRARTGRTSTTSCGPTTCEAGKIPGAALVDAAGQGHAGSQGGSHEARRWVDRHRSVRWRARQAAAAVGRCEGEGGRSRREDRIRRQGGRIQAVPVDGPCGRDLSRRCEEGRQGREAGRDASVRRPRAVRVHAAIAEAAGGCRRAFAAGRGNQPAEHQDARKQAQGPAKKP